MCYIPAVSPHADTSVSPVVVAASSSLARGVAPPLVYRRSAASPLLDCAASPLRPTAGFSVLYSTD